MSSFKKYSQEFITKNLHFYLVDFKGLVVDSNASFMPRVVNKNIASIHPFFECFSSFADSLEKKIVFNCVHLETNEKLFITDVQFVRKEKEVLVVIQDFTQHYTTYQEVAQARNESIINSELIVLKNKELQEREEFKNSFIQNFSHELRNPLTSIISLTKLLAETDLIGPQKEMINFLLESNSNLKLMLEDVLSISTIASNKLQLQEKAFNLNKLINLLEFTYTAKAKQIGVEFSLKTIGKIPKIVEGDRLRLFQVLTNLLDNALKFTEEGSVSLLVSLNQTRANKANIRFLVEDTGIGIPEKDQESIFESFKQLNNGGKTDGTGLGLAIVSGLLQKMGSKIKVESVVGKGTKFFFDITFKIPLKTKKTAVSKNIDKELLSAIKSKNIKRFKLLIVEDDEQVQTVLFKVLINTDCFYIDLINDGSKVLQEVVNNSYDLILMDVNLPNVLGNHVARLIRDFPMDNINKIPIIGLTANVFNNQEKGYIKDGMNAVVSKPFDTENLLETILRHLK
ncbi:ATP-binding protein [uncultured Maribacter sp.]|uniref:hybrid sensor histidine kinase/response regulator n=1 Tax=uncultured Maribacter sp. TaxID=431308 RepID=UPI00260F22EF|nr:ATP-binding protein [uncultured Maribacter sp.]